MTREEAIKIIRKMLACTDLTVRANLNADMVSACNLAIKALEQEPILDKVRAEIDKIYEREGNSIDCLNALNELKQFIDKYKVESEET